MLHLRKLIVQLLCTDIPPALAGTAFNIEEGGGNFVVHWLNNKELHFTSSIEIFMEHLRKLTDHQMEDEFDIASQNGLRLKLDTGEHSK